MDVKEWDRQMARQAQRITSVGMGNAQESFNGEKGSLRVVINPKKQKYYWRGWNTTLGSSSLETSIGDAGARSSTDFRDFIKVNSEQAEIVLANITKQVDAVCESLTGIFAAVIEKDIPSFVLRRLAGENLPSDPAGLVTQTATEKLKEVWESGKEIARHATVKSMVLSTTLAGQDLVVDLTTTDFNFSWGDIRCECDSTGNIVGVNTQRAITVIGNLDKLKAKVEHMAHAIADYRYKDPIK
jgi:hypothetical protein